jgi:hypothetical protein
MMPGAVTGAFADQPVQLAPIRGGDRFAPAVQFLEDQTDAPKATGILDGRQEGQGLFNPLAGLLRRRFAGILRQARPIGTARRVKIADDHVVEKNVVQTARPKLAADQMGMNIQHRHIGQRFFHDFDRRVHVRDIIHCRPVYAKNFRSKAV